MRLLALLLGSLALAGCASLPERSAERSYLNAASATRLGEISAAEARHTMRGLRSCEALGASRYRHCALPVLARTGASAAIDGRMLFEVGGAVGGRCGVLSRNLAGDALTLGGVARSTLANTSDRPWRQVHEASRAVRGLAREVLRVATVAAWRRDCVDISVAS
jgi:hypothetical protein